MKTAEELRLEIAKLVQEYADLKYVEKVFIPMIIIILKNYGHQIMLHGKYGNK
jgi:hypothetical protein